MLGKQLMINSVQYSLDKDKDHNIVSTPKNDLIFSVVEFLNNLPHYKALPQQIYFNKGGNEVTLDWGTIDIRTKITISEPYYRTFSSNLFFFNPDYFDNYSWNSAYIDDCELSVIPDKLSHARHFPISGLVMICVLVPSLNVTMCVTDLLLNAPRS